jgi:hypothetical protein
VIAGITKLKQREGEREYEGNTGNVWRSLNPDNGLRLPKLYARVENLSRTADPTSEGEREPKVSDLKMEGNEKQMILDAIISAMAMSKDEGYQDDLAILWRKIATSERERADV